VNRIFAPGSATPEAQFKAVRKAADRGLYVVVRIDPMFPGITDTLDEFESLVVRAKAEGANHIVASLCDIDREHQPKFFKYIEMHFPEHYELWRKIYREWIGNDLNPTITYRRKIFSMCKKICDTHRITFSLCMEFEKVGNRYRGLNEDYMTSKVCEGKCIPIYYRKNLTAPFKPMAGCDGNCLAYAKYHHRDAHEHCKLACGFQKLGHADALRYEDYVMLHPGQKTLF
jgi:DNA repair photolyase